MLKEGLKILGISKPSKREEEKAEIERKRAHYFYHCERNPEGFLKLKVENFSKDDIARTLQESEKLKSTNKKDLVTD